MTLKQRIIETATELFISDGYSRTSTRDIANLLKISQPAIYHHFKNKETLYVAVLTNFATAVGTSLNEILDAEREDNNKLLMMTLHLQQTHPINLSLMLHDMDQSLSESSKAEVYKVWNKNYFLPFYEYFSSIENTLIESLNVISITQHYLRVLSAYVNDSFESNLNNELIVEDIVSIFLRGVCK